MSEKTFTIPITEEQANHLQRLGVDVDSKIFVIDRLFAIHVADEDTQLFSSVPFKHYMEEYEKAYLLWDEAKKEFENAVVRPAVIEKFGSDKNLVSWSIDNFTALECKVNMA